MGPPRATAQGGPGDNVPRNKEEQKVTLFDGVFDGKDPEKYARSFPIHSIA